MDSIAQFADNPTLRKVTAKSIINKGSEYEKDIDDKMMKAYQRLIHNPDSTYISIDSLRIKNQLIDSILTVRNIWKVSYSFVILRKFSGRDLENFNFKSVREMR